MQRVDMESGRPVMPTMTDSIVLAHVKTNRIYRRSEPAPQMSTPAPGMEESEKYRLHQNLATGLTGQTTPTHGMGAGETEDEMPYNHPMAYFVMGQKSVRTFSK